LQSCPAVAARGRAARGVRNAARIVSEQLEARVLLSAGDLDPTFGTGGIARLADSAGSVRYTIAADVVQGDGKILLAGAATDGTSSRLFLERLNADGSADNSFGNHGIVAGTEGAANSLVIEPNNLIVVGGAGYLARFNANGSPDATFGAAGVAPATAALQSIALAPDGKVDFSDLLVLGQNFGRSNADWSMGDFNGDGQVSFADLLLLVQNYGRTQPAAASSMLKASLVKSTRRAK
jgi:uncharacterized delta-60 repeat protein